MTLSAKAVGGRMASSLKSATGGATRLVTEIKRQSYNVNFGKSGGGGMPTP